ncbi:MAG: HPr family phosphocarrier protein [Ruminococcus sp.]|nr:HPr family phosphocarrier protein [Ruminococcus sp.]
MKQFTYTVTNEIGIHGRPAAELTKFVKGFASTVTIEKEGKAPVNATALMKLMLLGVACGDTVKVTVTGADEEQAAKALEEYMTKNL